MSQTNRRIAEALESIAESLRQLANPRYSILRDPGTVEPFETFEHHLLQRDDDQ
jgi:hypothetical protein